MSNLDRSRKLFVRSVLAGTSTFATLMGAQSLALIDNQMFEDDTAYSDTMELTAIPTLMPFPTAIPTNEIQSDIEPTIAHIAPNITIFRQAGASNASSDSMSASVDSDVVVETATVNTTSVILPPNPIELQAPEPIVIVETPTVIQQPVQQIQPPAPQPQIQPQQNNNQNNNRGRSRSGSSK